MNQAVSVRIGRVTPSLGDVIVSTPYVPLYGSNSYQPGLKTFEKKADPEKLKRLIEAGEKAHESLLSLPKELQEAYAKQFKMLCDKVDELKVFEKSA